MAAFYEYFNEQKYADAVKNVSVRLPPLFHAINLQHFVDSWNILFVLYVR